MQCADRDPGNAVAERRTCLTLVHGVSTQGNIERKMGRSPKTRQSFPKERGLPGGWEENGPVVTLTLVRGRGAILEAVAGSGNRNLRGEMFLTRSLKQGHQERRWQSYSSTID